MGAKTAIIMYADEPPRHLLHGGLRLDEPATAALVAEAFPGVTPEPAEISDLSEQSRPQPGMLFAARYPGVDILTCQEFMLDHPGGLPRDLLDLADGRTMYLHCMHSVVDWACFGEYRDGDWRRLLSLSPDSGIIADIGTPYDFETPFWSGEHEPYDDEDDEEEDRTGFPFHPLELAEAALSHYYGFVLEGVYTDLDAADIPLRGFRPAAN